MTGEQKEGDATTRFTPVKPGNVRGTIAAREGYRNPFSYTNIWSDPLHDRTKKGAPYGQFYEESLGQKIGKWHAGGRMKKERVPEGAGTGRPPKKPSVHESGRPQRFFYRLRLHGNHYTKAG
jgi:hypothetical protein